MVASIHDLNLLGTLTELYCQKYRVNLVPSKTNLLVYSKPSHKHAVDLAKLVNLITIGGEKVEFSSQADHVGVTRSSSNLVTFLTYLVG